MSATDWGNCPRCAKTHAETCAIDAEELDNAYGVVAADEYLRMQRAAAEYKREGPNKETLREDYEAYMPENGAFFFHYACNCEVCDFSFTSASLAEQAEV